MFRIRLFLVSLICLLVPGIALAQTVPDPKVDPLGLVQAIIAAVQAHNWLVAVPLVLVGLVWLARKYGAKWIPWLATNAGGALLSLIAAIGAALLAAAQAGGTALQVVFAAIGILFSNQITYTLLKKLLAPSGADKAQDIDTLDALAAAKAGAVTADGVVTKINDGLGR